MPTLELIVRLEVEGVPVSGFPLRRTRAVAAVQTFDPYQQAHDPETFKPLPIEELAELQVLAMRPNGTVMVRLAGQTTHGIPVNARGCVLIFGGALCQPPAHNATLRNDRADEALVSVRGIAAGGPSSE